MRAIRWLSRAGSGEQPITAHVRPPSSTERITSSTRHNLPALRASLFITCFNDTLFPETGIAVVRLLERLGVSVEFPLEQTCCGQMHLNSGYPDEALPLLRRFVRAFGEAEVVVSPSASCVGMVRDQYPKLAHDTGDPALASEVEA